MKVKTLLKTFFYTEYKIVTKSGSELESNLILDKYRNESDFEDREVERIKTVANCDILFITVK